MRTAAALALALAGAAVPASATKFPRLVDAGAGVGVTPGGLVWKTDGKELALLAPDGTERSRTRLRAGEGVVLSAADDLSRITSRFAGGLKPSITFRTDVKAVRLVMRDAAGQELRTIEADDVVAGPAFRGREAYFARRDGGELVVFRATAEEGSTPALRVSRRKVLEQIGKVSEVVLHASPSGLLVEVRGPYRAAFLDADGSMLVPDPAADCGSWERSAAAFRGPERSLYRLREGSGGSGGRELQRVSKDGHLVAAAALPAGGVPYGLATGEILVLDDAEAVLLDDAGRELSRTTLALGGGLTPALARRLAEARRKFAAGGKPTGADWVELALSSPEPPFRERDAVVGDFDGAFRRLLAVPDGSPDAERAASLVASVAQLRAYAGGLRLDEGPDARRRVLERLREGTHAAARTFDDAAPFAPEWFRLAAAPYVLSELKSDAGPWALDALARRVAKGDVTGIPGELVTPDLADRIAVLDRERLDALDRRGVTDPNEASFHVPPRFAGSLVDCLPGAGPQRMRAVLQALSGVTTEAAWSLAPPEPDEDLDETFRIVEEAMPARRPADDVVVDLGALEARLAASVAPEAEAVRALLAPGFGAPLDAAAFRARVLPRAELASFATATLLADRSLPPPAWKGLALDLIGAARKASRAPAACAEGLTAYGGIEGERDTYCEVLEIAASARDDGEEGPGRGRELAELAASPAAPPELRLASKLRHAFGNDATPREALALLDDPELPRELGWFALSMSAYRDDGKARLAEIAPELVARLRSGRLSRADEASLLGVLAEASPAEIGRLAAERLVAGTLRVEDADAADRWLKPLDPAAVAVDANLKAALVRLLADENAGPRAAALLARSGDPVGLPQLVFGMKTGCFH